MKRSDWVITKRQLGLAFLALGAVGLAAIFGIDILRGREFTLGPTQVIGLGGCALMIVVGLTLLPLGDRPA